MNFSTAIFLINNHARAILVTYESEETLKNPTKTMFKTFDPDLKVDDYVVVPTDTRHKMTVVKVVAVDVDVDFDSSTQVAWVIGRVELADYTKITQQEDAAILAIKSAEKLRKKKELRDSLLADSMETIKMLPIVSLDGITSIPSKETPAV